MNVITASAMLPRTRLYFLCQSTPKQTCLRQAGPVSNHFPFQTKEFTTPKPSSFQDDKHF
jgi:hypothetical protein